MNYDFLEITPFNNFFLCLYFAFLVYVLETEVGNFISLGTSSGYNENCLYGDWLVLARWLQCQLGSGTVHFNLS